MGWGLRFEGRSLQKLGHDHRCTHNMGLALDSRAIVYSICVMEVSPDMLLHPAWFCKSWANMLCTPLRRAPCTPGCKCSSNFLHYQMVSSKKPV